jgi:hypothetical protein
MIQMHPAFTAGIAAQRRDELISQAEAHRLVRAARAQRPRREPVVADYRRGLARLRLARAR